MGLSGLTRRFTLAFVLFMIGPGGMLLVAVSGLSGRAWPADFPVGSLGEGAGVAGLELAPVLRELRAELNEAMGDAEGERLRFGLGPVDLSDQARAQPPGHEDAAGPDGKSPAPLIEGKPLPGER